MSATYVIKFASYCRDTLDLDNAIVPTDYGYNNLILCVIDAIFSMGTRYQTTRNTVHRFIEYFDVQKDMSVTDFINLHKKHTTEFMAESVYQNRQRTSPTNGILKAQAVLEVAMVLQKHDIERLENLSKIDNHSQFEADYKAIRGQSSGISLRYVYMLAGDDSQLKPDRMIMRFVHNAIEERVSVNQASQLINDAYQLLNKDFPQLTIRSLDNAIWKYQRSQR